MSAKSGYHAANPNPQSTQRNRFNKPNLAEFQAQLKGSLATGLPGIMPPTYPNEKFGRRVIFPHDTTSRRDI